VDAPAGPVFPVQSLIDRVNKGDDRWDRPIVMENLPQAALDGSFYEERALRTEQHKLIIRKFDNRPDLRPGELYDLRTDPEEKRNLWAGGNQTVRQLSGVLEQWAHKHGDEVGVELGRYGAR
jgi:hypothetical protein